MKAKIFKLFLMVVLLNGCAGMQKQNPVQQKSAVPVTQSPAAKHPQKEGKPAISTGLVFAKTQFEGVVKTAYIELSIVDDTDPNKKYQLFIGDKARQVAFPWISQTVNPGYFFIELPEGGYHIYAISIPVGRTTADEAMDMTFHVQKNKIIYMGTLHVTGTKETIKLGGVPVIKPGFEYVADVIDERDEAFPELRERFPRLKGEVVVELMRFKESSTTNQPGKNPKN